MSEHDSNNRTGKRETHGQAHPVSPLRRGTVRAIAPASVVAIVATGAALAPQFAAAAPALPPISAQNLLVKVAQSKVDTYSGTVALTTNLGLPALPNLAGGANPLSLLSGTHTLQVAANGPQKQRLALLDSLSEYDMVRNGTQLWLYDSSHNSVEHATMTERPGAHKPRPKAEELTKTPLTPQQAAQRLLDALSPSTNISVDGTQSVAGRDAYTLRLTPKQSGSLIGEVTIAVDYQNGAPLQVAVYPAGSGTPAFEVGFTSVSFSAPGNAQFDFKAPKGATVQEMNQDTAKQAAPSAGLGGLNAQTLKPQALGRDWLTVVELHGVDLNALSKAAGSAGSGSRSGGSGGHGNATGLFNGDASSYLDALIGAGKPVSGAFGSGKLYTTNFLSLLVTDDGRLFAGAVTPAVLEADAAAQGTK
ncbi:hypothetical protein KGA66_04185 [Actinocrinis puniceicyclus]|uniref:Outer membrane lipoprotein carrier protein LolA n=1 Tax=Actinocrinis puniceicyclus TaxID=977794 RepID=A0A8J7WHI2_9ACTN|nr:hypothetical protein [Actinocrinis puniceicyclus]MBS2962231.1 hypothetical protein [Actinocrinis puniceicyclus]